MSEYSMVRETPPAGWEGILRDRNTRTFIRSIKDEAVRTAVAFTDLAGVKAIMQRHLAFETLFKAIPMHLRGVTGTLTVGAATRSDALMVAYAPASAEATLLTACATKETVMRPQGMDFSVRAVAKPDDGEGNKVFEITVVNE